MGKKMIRRIVCTFLLCVIMMNGFGMNICMATSNSDSEDFAIEQIQATLPYVYAYCHLGDNETNMYDIEFSDGSEADFQKIEDAGDIHYYILLDNSGTVRDYFDDVKAYLCDTFLVKKGDKDKVTLHLVSDIQDKDQWEPMISGETDGTIIKTHIEKITCDGNNTFLHTAIYNTAKEAEQNYEEGYRNVIVVISDGNNESSNKSSYSIEEANTQLNTSGTPLYSIVLEQGDEDKDNLAALARKHGGISSLINSESSVETEMSKIFDYINNIKKLSFISDSEVGIKDVSIFSENGVGTRKQEVNMNNYDMSLYDEKTVLQVDLKQQAHNQLIFTVDATLEGLEDKENYEIHYESEDECDDEYFVKKVDVNVIEKSNKVKPWKEVTEITLTLNQTLYNGVVDIEFKKAIQTQYGKPLGVESKAINITDQNRPSKTSVWLKQYAWIIIALILVIVIVVVILVLVLRKIKKKGGIVYVENEAILADNVIQKQHVHIEKEKGLFIKLIISGGSKDSIELSSELKGSLIVGRSDLSDVFIDDSMMSRQHFVLTDEDGVIYIQDLETTNGTMLNGVRITKKQQVKQNDVISAGGLQIRIDW